MTTASEEVPAEEGLGPADLLAAQRAVARRLRQAGTLHLSDHTFDLPVVLALGQPSGRPPCGRLGRHAPSIPPDRSARLGPEVTAMNASNRRAERTVAGDDRDQR
jgi:hypothetical protein